MALSKLRFAEIVHPSDVCHFARVRTTSQRSGRPHTHDFIEVFWVENGPGRHLINGQRRILEAGTVVFVRARDQHDFSCAEGSPGLELANLAFAPAAWTRLRRRYFGRRVLAWDQPTEARREVRLPPKAFQRLRAAGDELSAGGRDLAALDRFLLNLLHLTDPPQEISPALPTPEVPIPSWLRRACEHSRRPENLAAGVPGLVRLAARHPAHVSRQFRRHLGCTPTEWVNHARLSHAAERLAGSDAKILDLIADCGSQNPRHFYALFHARFGVTPRQFRLREQRVLKPAAPC